jgi:3-methyladenine DNA glycosylase AlkD
MTTLTTISSQLQELSKQSSSEVARFFKTEKGSYAEHDRFLGINVPTLRKISKEYNQLTMPELQELLASSFNEERLLALLILVDQYNAADILMKEQICQFYLDNLKYVNNWNLVDASAHYILGAHLLDKEKTILSQLSTSSILWERRVAIVATWYFIKRNQFEHTLDIALRLLGDKEDLIHKAVGWMLREMGKKDQSVLIKFLEENISAMPRTCLRYAIEKFPEEQRKYYLGYKK